MEENSQIELLKTRLHSVGFDPMIILLVVQAILAVIKMCYKRKEIPLRDDFGFVAQLRLLRALRKEGVPDVLEAIERIKLLVNECNSEEFGSVCCACRDFDEEVV